jgi:signal peptide peptidase SppA
VDEQLREFLMSFFEQVLMLDPRHGQRLQHLAMRLIRGDAAAEAELRDLMASRRREDPRGAYDDDDERPGHGRAPEKLYALKGSIAVARIRGVLVKSEREAQWYGGTSYERIRQTVAAFGADGSARGMVFRMDTPGGAAMPVETAAADIFTLSRAAARGKPIWAFGEDGHIASAGVYLASQCNRVLVTPGAWIGSIGTILMVADYSKALEEFGIRVNIIKSTDTKDIGTPYRPMTEKDREILQAEVDTYEAQFVAALVRGYGVDKAAVRGWQKVRGFVGQDAVAAGLAHGVRNSCEAVIAEMEKAVGGGAGGPIVVRGDAGTGGGGSQINAQAPDAESGGGAGGGAPAQAEPDTHIRGTQDMAADARNTGDGSDSNGGGGSGGTLAAPPENGKGGGAPKVHTDDSASDRMVLAAERTRTLAINERAARAANVEGATALRDQAIEQGWTADQFGAKLFDLMAEKKGPAGRGPDAGDESNRARKRSGLSMVLAARTTSGLVAALEDGGERAAKMARAVGFDDAAAALACYREACANGLRGHSLLYIAQNAVAASRGVNLERVMAMNPAEFMAAAFMGSSDFPSLLSNVANKSLLAAFTEMPVVWSQCCARGVAVDYKTRDITSLSEAPNFELIHEGRTPSEGKFADRKESISVDPYGKRFSFTYQMLRNDDLSAFARFTQLVGQAARRTPEDAFFALLALGSGLGPLMADGVRMFDDAAHRNVSTGAGLSYAAAQVDYTKMRSQVGFGANAAPLDIMPKLLLVPLALEFLAKDIANQQYVPGTAASPSSATQLNQLKGSFTPVASPRLTGTRRYWFADPALVPAVQVDFLDGQETPEITIINDGDPMSQRFQATMRGFGIAAVQYEAALTNAGQ